MLQQSCQPVHCCSQITLSFECAEEHKCVRIEALGFKRSSVLGISHVTTLVSRSILQKAGRDDY